MNTLWFLFVWFVLPVIAIVILSVILAGVLGEPPKKKYWGTGESWWPDEEDW